MVSWRSRVADTEPTRSGAILQRGGDPGGERDVLADADHVAGLAGGPHGLVDRGRVDDGVVAVAGELAPEHVDADRGEDRPAGGAGVQR